uniref:Calpain catalytic domain-containing protein n=1 Tax=Globisporangium ultimum (strain ATCC 200006 / CBS 805.95 / DAOM BR144) TaxID=431595 RepID=K3X588_GLOUD
MDPPRRLPSAEQLYADAFASAERAKSLEREDGDVLRAVQHFQDAIRILSRLAIVESAAKRQLVQDAIEGLRERVDKLEATSAYALARAMEENEQAKRKEEANDAAQADDVVEAYLVAGDWYMKAYAAFVAEDSTSKAAVKEQIEYIIEHVSKLKASQSNAAQTPCYPVASPPPSAELLNPRVSFSSLEWPEPPANVDDELLSATKNLSIMPAYAASASPAGSNFVMVTPATAHGSESKAGTAYTPQELDVLRRSSLINGHLFVPWLDDLDTQEQFETPTLFVDPDGEVPLSAKQLRKGAQWMRPSEFAQLCGKPPVMIANINPQVVKQDIVTDCSFVASLCITAAYEQRFKKPLITNIIYPVDPVSKTPVYNPCGKYVVKLWANGVPRKVVIDDLLPVNTTTGQLLSSCTTQENELWVSLIEKAYLKLNGGYDFPGGNSGIDLFALTGWIPERIAITDLISDSRKEDRLWEQLKSAFHYGDCIITMSTGDIEKEEAKHIGLVPMHVYAVLNVYEVVATSAEDGSDRKQRLLQLKNPWRKMSWKGPFSKRDEACWQSAIGDELRAYQRQFYRSDSRSGDVAGAPVEVDDDGLFWIDFDSVKKYYESIYLNWNPALFPFKDVCHEHWSVELGPANDSITLGFNPQYSLTFQRADQFSLSPTTALSTTVWVLLTRHVRVVERDVDQASQQFLTLHVYHGKSGKRVFYSQNALWRGAYSNNPHTLVSLDVDLETDQEPSFTLVASQYEKFAPLDYTISVFSTSQFTFQAVPQILTTDLSSVEIQGEWDDLTAGGRPFFSSFMNNPQYHIQLTSPCRHVYVFLEEASFMRKDAASASAPVNLRAALHTRERLCGLSSASSLRVLSSGEYRPGFCMIEMDADDLAGLADFVLVPSTFEPGSKSAFTLRVLSDPPNAVMACRAIPPEGYGMELVDIRGRWDLQTGSAAGCSNYGCYTFNPKYLVRVLHESEFFVRLQIVKSSHAKYAGMTAPAINVSIFASTSNGDLMLSSNPTMAFAGASSDDGVYTSGSPSGVVTGKHIRFPAGWYVILPSTFEPQEYAFELKIYSSSPVEIRSL